MARDLSVQAILTANTTPFANGMKQASAAAQKFSGDMKRIRQQISQPLFVPRPGIKKEQGPLSILDGTITEALLTQRVRMIRRTEEKAMKERQFAVRKEQEVHNQRFEMIRRSEEKALKLRQFYARKEAELAAARGGFGISSGVMKKAFGAAGLAAGLAGEAFGSESGMGRIGSAIGNIGGQAAMGGIVGGPWGAAIFGGIAALKEFKGALDGATQASREAAEWSRRQTTFGTGNLVEHGRTMLGEIQSMRQGAFPEIRTEADVRRDIVSRIKQQSSIIDSAEAGEGGFTKDQIKQMKADRLRMLDERIGFDRSRDFRDSGAQGLQALFQSRGAFGDTAMQFGRQGLGLLGAGIGNLRTGFIEAQRMQRLSAREELLARAQMLMGQSTAMGAPLAIRGSNEYLRQISDQPKAEKDLAEIAKTAKEQLAEEKKQTAALEKVVIEQVTVNM